MWIVKFLKCDSENLCGCSLYTGMSSSGLKNCFLEGKLSQPSLHWVISQSWLKFCVLCQELFCPAPLYLLTILPTLAPLLQVEGVLPKPVTVNAVCTNGVHWQMTTFQLNTMDLGSDVGTFGLM